MTRMKIATLQSQAIELLKRLIETPSPSQSEEQTAQILQDALATFGIETYRKGNNVWAFNRHFDPLKPNLLLNSHHDTVKPHEGYTMDPFEAALVDDKLYGLGSNDAGGCLVSLLQVFSQLYNRQNLSHNLIFLASAEEELSGSNGISLALTELPSIDLAIVGEPTGMHIVIAEKGLMVIDGVAKGVAGHAAHTNAENAIYKATKDIQAIQSHSFSKISASLGAVKTTVTNIHAGGQHNVIPESCHYVIDVRTTDCYTNEETFKVLDELTTSELKARSFRLKPSSIDPNHKLALIGKKLGLKSYGSPTLSDQALLPCPSVKIGPGRSERSHQANEFITLREIEDGIKGYYSLLDKFLTNTP